MFLLGLENCPKPRSPVSDPRCRQDERSGTATPRASSVHVSFPRLLHCACAAAEVDCRRRFQAPAEQRPGATRVFVQMTGPAPRQPGEQTAMLQPIRQ